MIYHVNAITLFINNTIKRETKGNETRRNETKRNEIKWKERKNYEKEEVVEEEEEKGDLKSCSVDPNSDILNEPSKSVSANRTRASYRSLSIYRVDATINTIKPSKRVINLISHGEYTLASRCFTLVELYRTDANKILFTRIFHHNVNRKENNINVYILRHYFY